MLEVEHISAYYGNACALHDVSFRVSQKEIIAIIGANGAGKSTLMKSVMSVVRPREGKIAYRGTNITHMPTHQIVSRGIVYVPEGRDVFATLSVQDNLSMGAYTKKLKAQEINALHEEMFALFPRLKERRRQQAGTLSGGEQQMLAIARGLMSKPDLIMFDEPSLGLAPIIVDEVFDCIQAITARMNIAVVLVEQNAFMALSISDRCYVLENGRVAMEGKSSELIDDETIKSAYLGM